MGLEPGSASGAELTGDPAGGRGLAVSSAGDVKTAAGVAASDMETGSEAVGGFDSWAPWVSAVTGALLAALTDSKDGLSSAGSVVTGGVEASTAVMG